MNTGTIIAIRGIVVDMRISSVGKGVGDHRYPVSVDPSNRFHHLGSNGMGWRHEAHAVDALPENYFALAGAGVDGQKERGV